MQLRVGLAELALHGEDRALVRPDLGLFGVFDGLGGEGNGAEAAEAAVRALERSCSQATPGMAALITAITDAHNAVLATRHHNGYTTAVVAWIHGEVMDWVSLGDSRIYAQKPGEPLRMLSRDEGRGNVVDNYLGERYRWQGVCQKITMAVEPGMRVLLVSDGITGDWPPEFLTIAELMAAMVGRDAQTAAAQLVEVAKKQDDRTAIVIDCVSA